jgi:NADH:ubiquinone oxidoreductase subunit B-like Fe-S oxidoreductase
MKQRRQEQSGTARNPTGGRAIADSLWIFHLWLSYSGLEVEAAAGPRFDWERLGCRIVDDHRNADALFVSGPVTPAIVPELQRVYQEMRDPKFVVAVGSCASTGGMFALESKYQLKGLDAYIPVDFFIPGSPPRPESLIHAVLRLQEKLGRPKG